MSSQLNISNIKPLTGSGTINIGSTSSNSIQINTTTQAVTLGPSGSLEGNTIKGISANNVNFTAPITIGGENFGGRRNLVYNGAMKISQTATSSTTVGGSNGYPSVDRFGYFASGDGRVTHAQASITDLPGFTKALKLSCTTADTSLAATDYFHINYGIEGQDLQRLKMNTADAKNMQVSFYVKGNANATYTFRAQTQPNGGTARWFAKEFSVTSSWQRVTITIPGDTDTSSGHGIDDNANLGMWFIIYLYGGSNYSSGTFAESTWQDRDYTKAIGDNQTNFFDSTDRTIEITGFQAEIGETVTEFEHKTFQEDLRDCNRYLCVWRANAQYHNFAIGRAYSTTKGTAVMTTPVPMRALPTLVTSTVSGGFTYSHSSFTITNHEDALFQQFTMDSTGAFTSNGAYAVEANAADIFIEFRAEVI